MQIKSVQFSLICLVLGIYFCNMLKVTSCRPLAEEEDDDYLFIRTYDSLSDIERNQVERCEQNMTLMELCMRCAKETKHPFIYPMCCGDEADMIKFCVDYVYFGA